MLNLNVLKFHEFLYQGVKSKNKKALSYDKTEDVELPTKRLCTSQRKKQAVSLSKSSLEKTPSRSAHLNDDLFSDSSSEELQTLSRRTVLRHQEEEVLIHESKVSTFWFILLIFCLYFFLLSFQIMVVVFHVP